MQKYNYHCHNSFENIFDGQNTVEEMLSVYKKLGFEEVGISNHFICHRAIEGAPFNHNQNFYDIDKFIDVAKRLFAHIDEVSEKLKIKVYKGFEVDYFFDKKWRNDFEKMIKLVKPDYLIGTSHYLSFENEDRLYNLYHLEELPKNISDADKDEMLNHYWNKEIEAIKSGYFDFMAHPDYCSQFGLCLEEKWFDKKMEFISVLHKENVACEINTGGMRREIGRPYPDWWMVKEMILREIPLFISDDAHFTKDVASNFEDVEEKLAEFGCKKRYKLSK